jgi:hypothetical protein
VGSDPRCRDADRCPSAYASRTSSLRRPRSATLMPCSTAHARIVVVEGSDGTLHVYFIGIENVDRARSPCLPGTTRTVRPGSYEVNWATIELPRSALDTRRCVPKADVGGVAFPWLSRTEV